MFVAQVMDVDDPLLGIVPDMVAALAGRCDEVTVIANEVRRVSGLPSNVRVRSLGKEQGAGRAVRGASYAREILRAMRDHPDALVVHMSPIYADIAAPIARAFGVPILLWFAHPRDSLRLAVAERTCNAILTSLPTTFPRSSSKVRVVGQAVDVARFTAPPPVRGKPMRLLALGRTAPVKGLATVVRAVSWARERGTDVSLSIAGPSGTPSEVRHLAELRSLIKQGRLESVVAVHEQVPREDVPELIRAADVLVNATVEGSGDKVVFEAMSMRRPVLVSNSSFAALLDGCAAHTMFRESDDSDLGAKLGALAAMPQEDFAALGASLRQRVEVGHSLDHWADEVLDEIARLRLRAA